MSTAGTEQHVRLSTRTTLGVGGPAGRVVSAGTPGDILRVLGEAVPERGATHLLVLGGGTNVVVSDAGFAGDVLVVEGGGMEIRPMTGGHEVEFSVDAGVSWDGFVSRAVEQGCGGVEMMSGVPGSVVAAPIQNIGAYGQQVCDVIESVEVVDRASLAVARLTGEECAFGFRSSRFKTDWSGRYVVSRVHFRLRPVSAHPPSPSTYVDIVRHFERQGGSPVDLGDRRHAVLSTRRRKSMLVDPDDPNARSVGSFFINPSVPVAMASELAGRFESMGLPIRYLEGRSDPDPRRRRVPAAHLLLSAGFHPGDSWGPVKLSDRHVLALVTRPGATATDVWMVANHLQRRVEELMGVRLEFEATFIGEFPHFDAGRFAREYTYEPAPDVDPEWLAGDRRDERPIR